MGARAENAEVIVIGGGIVGLAVAWRASQRGLRVTLLERDTAGSGTSSVAAGMLAPVSEVEFGEAGARALELGLRSALLWREFADELEAVAGEPVGVLSTGTLMVARDADEARELERQLSFRGALGLRAMRARASEARELEPALAPTIRLALELPDDHSVDPRLALAALRAACAAGGVRVREQACVTRVVGEGGAVSGVELEGGERVLAPAVVVAMGAFSAGLNGVPERVPVRPVKGQTLRLRDPAGPGLLRRGVRFEDGYLVPRADGRYVLGGTVEERGFDQTATAGGIYELLRECHELVPGVSELVIEELCVGLRPGTPDNLPAIGPSALSGLVWATGHYRNGILLAPLTAELVVGLLTHSGGEERLLAACDPRRFAEAGSGRAAAEGLRERRGGRAAGVGAGR